MSDAAGGLLLAFDTCLPEGVVAAARGESLLQEVRFATRKGATGSLMRVIDESLRESGAGASSIGTIAVGTGPGTFTGLKVGVATAKALCLALGVPLVGVPTLDTVAAGACRDGSVLAVVEPARGTMHAALYRCEGGVPSRVSEYVSGGARAVAALAARFEDALTLAGGGDELREALGSAGVRYEAVPGRIDAAALVALSRRASGETDVLGAITVQPLYLRRPV